MPIVARLFLAVGVLLALLVGVAGDAAAHAALVRTDPPAGAALPEAPTAIRLWFTEPLEPRYTRAQVLDATGSTVPGVSSAIAPDDDHQLVVTLPADLPDGGYTVAWRNLSSADGHTLEGYFGIHVGAGATPGRTPGLAVAPANDTARALSRGLALIGLTAVLAIAPVTLGVLDPTARAIPGLAGRVRPRLRRYALLAASVALLGSVAALAAQAAAIAPDVALPTAIAETLAATRYGQLWLFRVLGLLLVTAAVAAALRGPPSWRRGALAAGTVVGLGVPVPFSLLSHAAAQPHGAATAVAVDALHLLAAAIWGGGLLLLAAVLAPALRPFAAGSWREALRVAIPRFSALGLAAWSVLWLSGLYGAWLQVGSLEALTQTPYGQSLLIKGALLIPVSALAAWHLGLGWRGVPGVQLRHAATTFALEALLVVAVLLVVGRLIGQEPAREVLASRTPPQIRVPLTFATDEGERPGQLVIAPGAAGANTFTLELGGLPVPAAAEGVLRFALPTQDIGQQELRLPQAAPNRFVAQGSELALGGDWQVAVIVRTIGAFSWSTDAAIPIGATPPPPPAVNPAPIFGMAGIVGAIVGAIGVAALAAAAVLRGVPRARRGGVAGVGLVAVAAGCVILGSARIPVAAPGAALAQAVPVPGSPPPATPPAAAEHDHALATPAMPVSESFAGIGTPVGENGLVVTLGADARQPGPTDLTITARDRSETPVSEARVVVFARMAGMGGNSQGTAAVEEEPGRYRAEDVPLSMAGTWQLTVRISPRGQPTSVVEFAIEVP
jgi:copper transport protein